jgi:6-phospho-beta-glucosidase
MTSLMRIVKAYERLTVQAAITGDDNLAMQALLAHPLVGDWAAARACYDEMKQAHGEYLPQF